MRRKVVFEIVICSLAIVAPDSAVGEGWRAGFARINITPEQPMWMSGYGERDKPAEGKRHKLWTKALVLEDATGRRAVLVTMDLVGISREISVDVCRRIEEQFGIPRANIVLAASHTHTGPVVAGNLMPMAKLDAQHELLIQKYASELQTNLVAVVGNALTKLGPVRISCGVGTASFAVNRRNNPEHEIVRRRAENRLVGPVDHRVPVLAIHDTKGRLRAIVAGYACHATVLNDYLWSGDWPGAAQLEIEKRHPDTIALYWAGCGGDQNPLPRRSVELMKQYGSEFADAVDHTLQSSMKTVSPSLEARYDEIQLPFAELPTRLDLELQAKGAGVEAKWAQAQLSVWDRDGELPAQYAYPIQVWNLGNQLTWVFLGGEVVVDYALILKHDLGPNTWVTAYANDVMGYIPSRRVLAEGGYEGGGARFGYGLPAIWNERVEETIIQVVDDLAKDAAERTGSLP